MAIADLPYLQARGDGGPRPVNGAVVIHATDNTASAAAEAGYATRRTDNTSAHFYVDDTEAYHALALDHIAYGCLYHGNMISVQFELCGRSNQISDATMRRAAPLVAEVCRIYGLPVERARTDRLRSAYFDGTPAGICGHDTVTAAFPEDNGDHTDPGTSFPWDTFIGYVRAALNPPNEEDDDMFAYRITLPAGPGAERSETIPWVNKGSGNYGPAWLNLVADNYGPDVVFRLALGDGSGRFGVDERVVVKSGETFTRELQTGTRCVSWRRLPAFEGDSCSREFTATVEYGKRA